MSVSSDAYWRLGRKYMNYLETANFGASVRDYEFTRKAMHQIFDMVSSESFEDLSADEIFMFLFKGIALVSFKDYLKRYLYERAEIEEPFSEVKDQVWQDIIMYAFEENNAPHSFEPTSTRWSYTVKSWLNSDRVRRSTVFLLGFGLKMMEQDVSDFLTRVLEEDNYHMDDSEEVVYRYCFRHQLPYSKAKALLEQTGFKGTPETLKVSTDEILQDEQSVLRYLTGIRKNRPVNLIQDTSRKCFEKLYKTSKEIIAGIYNQDEMDKPEKERREWTADDVSAADLEKMLCSGIPLTDSGNLVKANQSLLSKHFQNYRLSRQRVDGLMKGQAQPDRYDLITLCFFLHAQKEEITGEQRLSGFLSEINPVLASCGMSEIHPANPYEAFILICILSDCPMAVYGDIWELSYEQ